MSGSVISASFTSVTSIVSIVAPQVSACSEEIQDEGPFLLVCTGQVDLLPEPHRSLQRPSSIKAIIAQMSSPSKLLHPEQQCRQQER